MSRFVHKEAAASTVAFFSGSYPPDVCGVGDHTYALAQEAQRQGAQCLILRRMWCSVLWLLSHRGHGRNLCVVYPTARYGKSVAPHAAAWVGRLLGWKVSCIIHELSTLNRRARVAARVMFAASDTVFFTTQREIDLAVADSPWLLNRCSLLPISSNVPQSADALTGEKRRSLCYFGCLSPGKGIEQFMEVRSMLPDVDAHMIGATSSKFTDYCEAIIEQCRANDVQAYLNEPLDKVSEMLADMVVALLPFPDGVSHRRGSALAALLNGAIVVTTPPLLGAEVLSDICLCCSESENMASAVRHALAMSDSELQLLRHRGVEFAMLNSWPRVTSLFLEKLAKRDRT